LDELPKSNFNIDDWKREFFNSPDRAVTLQELWGKLDVEGWSVWKVQYIKYEGEGVVGYLTNNLKNGHLRNLDDHFRKYVLAAYGVYGEEGNFEIDGFWLWRGTEIPHFWKDHNTYDYFTFTKLDPKDPETHKLAAEYWLNVENENGVCLGRKVFDATWYR
jgi:elongation factor 1-gamma